MIDDAERERRRKRQDQAIEHAKATRRQITEAAWQAFESFVPVHSEFESDMQAAMLEYRQQYPEPIDQTDVTVRKYVWDHAHAKHPGDDEYRTELHRRLWRFVERRRLNLSRMSHGFGWQDVLTDFLDRVEDVPGFRLKDAGEKWGRINLRYSVDDPSMVVEAEKKAVEKSLITCEMCGEAGRLYQGGWWKVACEKDRSHYKQIDDVWREDKAWFGDVYKPDSEQYFRDWEFKYGWRKIVRTYLDQLRSWRKSGFEINLRWGKEKFGALRLFSDLNLHTATRLQVYRTDRLNEWARRKSLKTCDMCSRPGRLRIASYMATRCDEHALEMGEMRDIDGILLDPDRQKIFAGRAFTHNWAQREWSDKEIGMSHDEGSSWDTEKQFLWDFAPMLSDGVELPDDDNKLAELRKLLTMIDESIGHHRAVEFKLAAWGDRLSYTVGIDPAYAGLPVSTVDDYQRERIVDDIHYLMTEYPK